MKPVYVLIVWRRNAAYSGARHSVTSYRYRTAVTAERNAAAWQELEYGVVCTVVEVQP